MTVTQPVNDFHSRHPAATAGTRNVIHSIRCQRTCPVTKKLSSGSTEGGRPSLLRLHITPAFMRAMRRRRRKGLTRSAGTRSQFTIVRPAARQRGVYAAAPRKPCARPSAVQKRRTRIAQDARKPPPSIFHTSPNPPAPHSEPRASIPPTRFETAGPTDKHLSAARPAHEQGGRPTSGAGPPGP